MNDLTIIDNKEINLILTSREIAELTEKKHKNVMADIRKQFKELEIDGLSYQLTYIDKQNREKPMFKLDREQTLILISGYSIKLRATIIKRLEELENKQNYAIPQTFSEALTLAGRLQAEKEILLLENKKLKPKADFFNTVAGSKDAITIGKTAKALKMIDGKKILGRNKLFEILRNEDILMRDNIPYQKYIDNGWFRVIEQKYAKPDGEINISFKTLVYQKGLDRIRKLLLELGFENS